MFEKTQPFVHHPAALRDAICESIAGPVVALAQAPYTTG
jgi:hypothetical protein